MNPFSVDILCQRWAHFNFKLDQASLAISPAAAISLPTCFVICFNPEQAAQVILFTVPAI